MTSVLTWCLLVGVPTWRTWYTFTWQVPYTYWLDLVDVDRMDAVDVGLGVCLTRTGQVPYANCASFLGGLLTNNLILIGTQNRTLCEAQATS